MSEDELVFAENLGLEPGAFDRVGHESEVHVAARDLRIDLLRAPVFHMQLHFGILLAEGFQKRWPMF